MLLLDTNVVSELRRIRTGRADLNVAAWADRVDAESLHLSVITVMELEAGVLQIERKDRRQGSALRAWLETQVLPAFEGRIIAIDTAVARRCAQLHVPDRTAERDALTASTALVYGMGVVTRSVADFAATGVQLVDPWGALGPAARP